MNPKVLASFLRVTEACVHKPTVSLVVSASMALLAHLLFILVLPAPWRQNNSSDFETYYGPVAAQVAEGVGLYLPSGEPAVLYPPGIPLVYGATFWSAQSVGISRAFGMKLLQGFLVITGGVVIAYLSAIVVSWRVALIVSFIWSTYPLQLWLTKQPSGMNIVSILLLLCILLFLRWTKYAKHSTAYGLGVGAILAAAALVKPFGIALPLVFAALSFACHVPCRPRQRLLFAGCIVLMYTAAISPWELWARHATGHWPLLSEGGPAAMIDGLSFGLTRRNMKEPPLPNDVRVVARDVVHHARQLTTIGRIIDFLLVEGREKPLPLAHLFLVKAICAWYGNDSHSLL